MTTMALASSALQSPWSASAALAAPSPARRWTTWLLFVGGGASVFGAALLYEHARWFWHRRARRAAVAKRYAKHCAARAQAAAQGPEASAAATTSSHAATQALPPPPPPPMYLPHPLDAASLDAAECGAATALLPPLPGSWASRAFASLAVAGRYCNPFSEWQDRCTTNLWEWLRWRLSRVDENRGLPVGDALAAVLPSETPDFDLLARTQRAMAAPTAASRPAMAITWIGQSTCVVQMGGKTLLTDPIFQMRTVDYIGPKRLRPPPCTLEALPPVDLVLVSHNHYDHLDAHVVDAYGDSVTWVVPLGLGPWFRARGVTNLVELDWWASARVAGLQIVATPAQHWSGRHFFDVNASLWCSFLVRDDQQTGASFFHCGDSGYCPVFGEVRALFGDVTAAALPIGSYAPRWYMQHQHMDPREACCVHRDLGATLSIGVHWGTFLMSDEHFLRPPRELAEAAAAMNLPSDAVITTPFGRTVLVTMKQSSSANAEPQSDTISS